METPSHRARSPWNGQPLAADVSRGPVRQSLTRFYKKRTDPTRTRGARRQARARKLAYQLKHHPVPSEPETGEAMNENEARDTIIQAARMAADWWTNRVNEDTPCEERIAGAIFTFLAELDGVGASPACGIVVLESDEGGNTISETRVSTMLHEFFHEKPDEQSWRPLTPP